MGYSTVPEYGFFRFDYDARRDFMWANNRCDGWYVPTSAWMRNGRLCTMTELYIYDLADYRYTESDPYTGEIFEDRVVDIYDPVTTIANWLPYYLTVAYVPDEDRLYGYSLAASGKGYSFVTAPGDAPEETSIVAPGLAYEEICASLCYNPADDMLYGVNRSNQFVRISRDGGQEVISDLGVRTAYAVAGLCYDEPSGWFVWNAQLVDYSSLLMGIDPVTGTATEICRLTDGSEYMFIFSCQESDNPYAIASPVIDMVVFDQASDCGDASWFAPDQYFMGQPLEGELQWTLAVDGDKVSDGTCQPGRRVSAPVGPLATGLHTFSFSVSQGRYSSPANSTVMYVGYDTPLQVEKVDFDGKTISWTPVSRGEHGGYIDREELVYKVYLNGECIGETKETSLDAGLSEEALYKSYWAEVVADNHGMESEKTASQAVTAGRPWSIPAHLTPTGEEAAVCIAVDGNEDKYPWEYTPDEESGCGWFESPFGNMAKADDWLLLPPMHFDEPGAVYELSFDMAFWKDAPTMSMTAGLYASAESVREPVVRILGETRAPYKEYIRVSQKFIVPEAGVYYVGFYTDSDIYTWGIRIKNIDVTKHEGDASLLPGAVSNLQARGAERGELRATVSFEMPETAIDGTALGADLELTACVRGRTVETVHGRPRERVETTVETDQGMNTIVVECRSEHGAGQSTETLLFTGHDIPSGVGSMRGWVPEDNLSISCEWTAPVGPGEEGHYVDNDNVEYDILVYNRDMGWLTIDHVDSSSRTYTYSIPEGSELQTVRLGVSPVNHIGRSGTIDWVSDMLGTPWTLPMDERFANSEMTYTPIRILRLDESYEDSEWGVVYPSYMDPIYAADPDVCAYGRSEVADTRGMLMLPKFSTLGTQCAGLQIEMWTGVNMAPTSILADSSSQSEWTEIASIKPGAGWTTIELEFPDWMQNQSWCTLYISSYFPTTYSYTLIHNYKIADGISGIAATASDNDAAEVTWYLPDGTRVAAEPATGVCIRVERHSDGSVTAAKVVR